MADDNTLKTLNDIFKETYEDRIADFTPNGVNFYDYINMSETRKKASKTPLYKAIHDDRQENERKDN